MTVVSRSPSAVLNESEELLRKRIKEDMQEIALRERMLLSEMLENQFSRWDTLQRQVPNALDTPEAAKDHEQPGGSLMECRKLGPGRGVHPVPVAKPREMSMTHTNFARVDAINCDIDGNDVPCDVRVGQTKTITDEIEAALTGARLRAKHAESAGMNGRLWGVSSKGEDEEEEEDAFDQAIKEGRDGADTNEVSYLCRESGKTTNQVNVGWMNIHAEVAYEHEPKSILRFMRNSILEIYSLTAGRHSLHTPILVRLIDWLIHVKEPERKGYLSKFVDGSLFRWICSAVIVLNAWYVIYETNYEIQHLHMGPSRFMKHMQVIFFAFYALEIFLKLIVHKAYFFVDTDSTWNIFDFLLVILSSIELFLTWMIWKGSAQKEAMVNFQFMRAYRLLKISKIVRILKVVHFFSDIALMLNCILASLETLVGCFIMICFFLYFFSLFFVQVMTGYLAEKGPDIDIEAKTNALSYFGSAQDAALSLFQATTGGVDWKDVFELLKPVGWFAQAVFIFYIAFFVVVAWNVITSTFMEKAARLAQPDIDALMLDKHHQDIMDAKHMSEVFAHLDTDHSGNISVQEFMEMTQDPVFLEFMQIRGIDIKDAKMFFNMLVSGSRGSEVDIKTFIGSCLRMKGLATSIDLHTLGFEVKTIHKRLSKYQDEERGKIARLEKLVGVVIEKIVGMQTQALSKLDTLSFETRV